MIINAAAAVAYGLERLNREVSQWMKGPSEADDSPQMPFIATRGYDSIVWNRLYSRDSDLEDYQIEQVIGIFLYAHSASIILGFTESVDLFCRLVLSKLYFLALLHIDLFQC